jgi:hypothetical protein
LEKLAAILPHNRLEESSQEITSPRGVNHVENSLGERPRPRTIIEAQIHVLLSSDPNGAGVRLASVRPLAWASPQILPPTRNRIGKPTNTNAIDGTVGAKIFTN